MILICDVNILASGHYIGFNQFILDNTAAIMKARGPNAKIQYLYNAEAKDLLKFPPGTNPVFIDIGKDWRDSLIGKIKIWRAVIAQVKLIGPEELFFLDFDKYQLPMGVFSLPCRVSGIYFRPHHRIRASNHKPLTILKARFKRLKKIAVEKILLRNPQIKSIFILNDPKGVDLLNKFHNSGVFRYLSDPIFDYPYDTGRVVKDNSLVSLLLFGALTERKNITMLIKAYGQAKFSKKSRLRIVGTCNSETYLKYISALANELVPPGSVEKEIQIETGFVTDEEMEICHASSDISLLIYKDFFGSSGLLGRASKHKLIVLAPSVGLLNDLTLRYNLGITVDPFSLSEIAEAMEAAEKLSLNSSVDGHRLFYNDHKPDKFLHTLFE